MGVALVASAAVGLTGGTCKDRTTRCINAVAAVVSYYFPATYIFPVLILAGGLVTLVTRRKQARAPHAIQQTTAIFYVVTQLRFKRNCSSVVLPAATCVAAPRTLLIHRCLMLVPCPGMVAQSCSRAVDGIACGEMAACVSGNGAACGKSSGA